MSPITSPIPMVESRLPNLFELICATQNNGYAGTMLVDDTPSAEDSAVLLRDHGLRVTSGRVATIAYLATHPHSSATEICSALAADLPSVSQQSVHNIVQDLTECGILRRVDLPDSGSALYEAEMRDNHHHIQCVVCQRIEDVECAVGVAPCLTPSNAHGMRVIEAALTFRGVCRDCEPQLDEARLSTALSPRQEEPTTTSPHTT